MATAESVKAKIQGLITTANATTGSSDTDLTTAVNALVSGYGQGGGDSDDVLNALIARSSSLTSITTDAVSFGTYAFFGCLKLETIDARKVQSISNAALDSCQSMMTLILRANAVATLNDTSFLGNSHHFKGTANSTYNPNGYKDGLIFVRSSKLDSYKTATNWSVFAACFRALQDYTVDGTTTGELDMVKVQAERDRINGGT